MRESKENPVNSYECEKHGNIENQVFTLGYFDKHRNFIQNTFCGICHFKMMQKYCKPVKEIKVDRPNFKEKDKIILR